MDTSMTAPKAQEFILSTGRYNRTKPPTPRMTLAGFTYSDGRELTIELKSSPLRIWLEDGNWLSEDVKALFPKGITVYKEGAGRQSNIKAINGDKPMVRTKVSTLGLLAQLLAAYEGTDRREPAHARPSLSEDSGGVTTADMGPRSNSVTRLSFNSARWTRPTGEAAQQEVGDTFNARTGFGFEDWLFRDEWQLEGWRYAFLQGVNKSHAKLIREALPIDVTLFTVNGDKSRTFVAEIRDLECLTERQAAGALDKFKRHRWLNAMVAEVKAVGGDSRVLTNPRGPRDILNVRFRLDQVRRLDLAVPADDPVMHLQRYMLCSAANVADGQWEPPTRRGRVGRPDPAPQAPYLRKAIAPVFCTPEHAQMQKLLVRELRKEYPKAKITCEEDFVDVRLRNGSTEVLYEIKTDLAPKTVLRQAIGQLLEYAHHAGKEHEGELLFVAVGRNELSKHDIDYLVAQAEGNYSKTHCNQQDSRCAVLA